MQGVVAGGGEKRNPCLWSQRPFRAAHQSHQESKDGVKKKIVSSIFCVKNFATSRKIM